jgi:flagellar protein FliS
MIMQHSYETYKQQSVMTMTQAEMLTMLYDGIIKEIYTVEKAFAMDPQDIAEINRVLQKIQKIINYLKNSLDMNYDIAKNLYSLYDYCNWILVQANIKKDPSKLDEIVEMVNELKESYIQADKSTRIQTMAHVSIG